MRTSGPFLECWPCPTIDRANGLNYLSTATTPPSSSPMKSQTAVYRPRCGLKSLPAKSSESLSTSTKGINLSSLSTGCKGDGGLSVLPTCKVVSIGFARLDKRLGLSTPCERRRPYGFGEPEPISNAKCKTWTARKWRFRHVLQGLKLWHCRPSGSVRTLW